MKIKVGGRMLRTSWQKGKKRMNLKFGLMTGAAIACAVMTGCKAPKARTSGGATMEPTRPVPRTEVVTVEEKPAEKATKPAPFKKTAETKKAPEALRCTCAPGTVHDAPCTCGLPECACKVNGPEPEYTVYRIKRGDVLSSICATYGLKQKKVLDLNPGLDANKIYAGKQIKLPGKIELKGNDATNAQKSVAPTAAKSAATPAAKSAATPAAKSAPAKQAAKVSSYKGDTKEYVVKSGDSLGKIAYANGITIKCLKEMNGLKNNNIRIGQKLKVPAEKPVAAEKPAAEVKPEVETKPAAANAAPAEMPKAEVKQEAPAAPAAEPSAAAKPEEKPAEAVSAVEQVKDTTAALESAEVKTHTVKDGEDMVSIALLYSVSPSTIMDLNDLKANDTLTPGQVLKLPANAKMQ